MHYTKTEQHMENMGLHGSCSIIGGNKRYLENHFSFSVMNINKLWHDTYNIEHARIAEQIKEVCSIRDSCVNTCILNYQECKDIITSLCTM